MKKITSFLFLLLALVSCVKEKDYPVEFSYDYSVLSSIVVDDYPGTINVEDYTAILGDTSLDITGRHPNGTIHIHLPKAIGHSLNVGDFTTELNTGFSIYFTSSFGITTKAQNATLTLTHINSYVNFVFEAELYSGITLSNGQAKNLPFVTEAYFNSVDTNGVPPLPGSNIDTLTNGLYAEMDEPTEYFYQASKDITRNETDSSYQYRAINGIYSIDFELMKPLELLIDENIDIAQNNQELVLMQWKDLSKPAGANLLNLQSGNFKLFSIDPSTKELEFGFSGQLIDQTGTINIPIHVGYGKKI